MPKKEREAKKAAFAMKQELDSEMSEEQRERMEKSGMGIGGFVPNLSSRVSFRS